ncbi:hypothetical protein A7K93_07250 [Candidatus Methylacidiphilum fumarolicum]|nr:hypothetical protein [Candidatus Methylacidiphilum fumarolicum]TFE72977.1 hypothetical protein A7K93_07250 [Candidatus Methylacidiphilum fumarolicum]TFE75068.1 hypothetical protein A7K72_02435 [Candidatus Methylacidiphilum fumarolicum]
MRCENVYPKNPTGHKFVCWQGGYASYSDRVGAYNFKKDRKSGDSFVDAAKPAVCDAFGEVYL